MIRLFINQIKQLFTYNNKSVNPPDPKAEENILHNNNPYRSPIFKQSLTDDLDSACAAITIYMREDGEFAITSEFSHDNEEVAEISGRVLHMMNSGLLADYFLQSLQHVGRQQTEQKTRPLYLNYYSPNGKPYSMKQSTSR